MGAFAKGLAERGYQPCIFTSEQFPGALATKWTRLDGIERTEDDSAGTSTGRGSRQTLLEKVFNVFVPMEPAWTLSLPNLHRAFKPYAESERPDLIFTTSHPLASAVAGMMLKRRFALPLIVEFRDPWTLNPIRNWPTRLHFAVESLLERRVLRAADAVIMNTPRARLNLLGKYHWLDADRVHVISHGFDGDAIRTAPDNKETNSQERSDHKTLVYAGGFYPGRAAPGAGAKKNHQVISGADQVKNISQHHGSLGAGSRQFSGNNFACHCRLQCHQSDQFAPHQDAFHRHQACTVMPLDRRAEP